jgi:hypothetical protein
MKMEDAKENKIDFDEYRERKISEYKKNVINPNSVEPKPENVTIITVTNRAIQIPNKFIWKMMSVDNFRESIKAIITGNNVHKVPDFKANCYGEKAMTNLEDLVFNNGLYEIGEFAFKSSALKELITPLTLRDIQSRAFETCKNLKNLQLNFGLHTLAYYSFSNTEIESVFIPKTVDKMASAFTSCKKLRDVEFEDGISKIDDCTFVGCDIEKVNIPASVKTIGNDAFASNPRLNEAKFSEGLEEVGESAFKDTALQTVLLPESLKSADENSFGNAEVSKAGEQRVLSSKEILAGLSNVMNARKIENTRKNIYEHLNKALGKEKEVLDKV